MEINSLFPPSLATPDHIVLAEELGFKSAWIYDVPVSFADTGITLAAAAARTKSIRLGVSVFTPHLRHLTMNAALIAHLATIAPGRFDAAIGAGFSSAAYLARKPAKWAEIEEYVTALRTLLAGGEVDWEGAVVSLMHSPVTGITFPVEVPLWIAAHGPKGYATARRLGAGVITNTRHGHNPVPIDGLCALTFGGTVLDEGETYDSPRVIEAAGPNAAMALHLGEQGPLAGTDEARGYAQAIAAVDVRRQHLETHRGHLIDFNKLDRPFVTGEVIRRGSRSGTALEIATQLRRMEEAGATAVFYQPGGPDIPRELRAFREAAELRHQIPALPVPEPAADQEVQHA
ncbi:LLM class flavin-dependent oxidoreductase [Streptomyces chartreusis]|uniref:LLM class flavin-dependent oxidoreductase n=1 Tax=Streptomyces chartreusis TaxID=1969 RepID=A0A7H8T2U2_STRCX|nr:LLM class flavin-dependent oxidoreductase [Streptomyces chartreusis]QKZ17318.1 LLM class flavin-dependent oxidoreductase [Streptomyces chartreusis]